MCISLENAKEGPEYSPREERFQRLLARRNELRAIIEKKYPEVAEYLATFFAEKSWH